MNGLNNDFIKSFLQNEGKLIRNRLQEYTVPYRELLAYYRCAMMEVETKFRVLSEELSLEYDRNPIEGIKTRLKSTESITDKLIANGHTPSVENIEKYINDVAGVRVICAFPSDVIRISEAFCRQDDITVLERKDYMNNPKSNGYRSLHLIVEIPIYLHNETKLMRVEVQFRTLAMDWWASLEHKICYKKELYVPEEIEKELYDCAQAAMDLDNRMERIQQIMNKENYNA